MYSMNACEMLTRQERENEFKINTSPNCNSHSKIIGHTLARRETCKYNVFGDLTLFYFVERRGLEIVINDPPVIYCGYTFYLITLMD